MGGGVEFLEPPLTQALITFTCMCMGIRACGLKLLILNIKNKHLDGN